MYRYADAEVTIIITIVHVENVIVAITTLILITTIASQSPKPNSL